MNLQERIDLLVRLGAYMLSDDPEWLTAKQKASRENTWFIPAFINLAVENIAGRFLSRDQLENFVARYDLPRENHHPEKVGLVPAGNIPLVGFHDMMCIFLSGNYAWIKPSSKDEALTKQLVAKMISINPAAEKYFTLRERLNNCDAYIATGSNNTSRYFEFYFGKYPHIIRRNRTSAAILTGEESKEELEKLADDICQYFGMGCRNVTKLFVPENYDFIPLITALKKYNWLEENNKYKNNYDHNLALHILNHKFYMTNGSVLLVENPALFSPISEVHYEFYVDKEQVESSLASNNDVQCLVGKGHIPFGQAQCPTVDTFADGVDTMQFLKTLGNEKELRRS
jgi:hypothetical protein